MIDTKTTVSLRGQRQRQRIEKLRAAAPASSVRVMPANDDMRRVLKHPTGGGFRKEGAAEWPNDRFTKRRLADGTIKAEQRSGTQGTQRAQPERRPAQPPVSGRRESQPAPPPPPKHEQPNPAEQQKEPQPGDA